MNNEFLDDISQVSEISLKSLFKERNPEWKAVKEERVEPFYPNPKTRNEIVSKNHTESNNLNHNSIS